MTRLLLTVLALGLSQNAAALDLEVGAMLGIAIDMPDASPRAKPASFIAPSLSVPIGIRVNEYARLRAEVQLEYGFGSDTVSWDPVRFDNRRYASGREMKGWLGSAALLLGGDVTLPVDGGFRPYLGATMGPAWMANFHNLDSCELMDPSLNDCRNANNIDPWASQVVLASDFHVGGFIGPADGLHFSAELGYSSAWLDTAPLKKSAAGRQVQRQSFGWNPVRFDVGIVLPL